MSQGQANTSFPITTSSKVQSLYPGYQGLNDEGSFFVATNPTPGTAIATTTSVVDDASTQSSTHAQASPVMVIQNQWQPGAANAMNITPVYLKMLLSQVPTSATSWQVALRLDNLSNKLTTAGTAIIPVSPNSNSGVASRAGIWFGTNTTVIASASSRLVGRAQINSAVPVTADQWLLTFGQLTGPFDQISGGSGAKNVSIPLPPIVIAPGWSLTVEMWGASNAAAPSWEFELGYVERPQGQ